MRRTDREITDRNEIISLLAACDTVRIAMNGSPFPYVVPVSFGMTLEADKPVLYFHCAKAGEKNDRLEKDPHVCVEADCFLGVQKTAHGITTRYRSVIGFGLCTVVTDPEEILRALRLILEHYGVEGYPLDRCKGLENVCICRIDLLQFSGKQNLPENSEPSSSLK